jgi:hypothetical protein
MIAGLSLDGCAGLLPPATTAEPEGTAVVSWKIVPHGERPDCGTPAAVACTQSLPPVLVDGQSMPHYRIVAPALEHIGQWAVIEAWGHEFLHVPYGAWHGDGEAYFSAIEREEQFAARFKMWHPVAE